MANKLEAVALSAFLALTSTASGAPRRTFEDSRGHAALVNEVTVFDCEKGPTTAHVQFPLRKREINMVYGHVVGSEARVGAGVEYRKKFEEDGGAGLSPYTTNLPGGLIERPGELFLPTPEVDITFTRVDKKVLIDVNCNIQITVQAPPPQ